MKHVIVIGAGIIGTTTALALAGAGCRVTVIDSRSEAGLETSFANGGLLAANSALPWSSPGTPLQLLKWLGREDAPLLLRPRAIPGLGMWGLRFLANCRASKYQRTAAALTAFGQHSLAIMERLLGEQRIEAKIRHGGLLELIRGKDAERHAEDFARMLERMGAKVTRLDGAQTAALEPTLAPIANSIGTGLLLESDAWGDARAFSVAAAAAAQRQGVTFRWNADVLGIDVRAGAVRGVRLHDDYLSADSVVVCAGALSPAVVAPLGVRLPMAPVKGYSLTLAASDLDFMPARPIVDDFEHIGVTPLGDTLRVAGTVEFDGFDKTLRPARVDNLRRALSRLFPRMTLPDNVRPWCGLRPMAADGLPLVSATRVPQLFVNTGHGALGWTLACGSAELVTSMVTGQTDGRGSPFSLTRSFW
ncbi:FAD-dependent oxidoreductase [Caballeronia sp. LZ035]|uniref:FAD-dependent oxidoreductase n=1 Tax=Caballeronia sp. LZ035 TaxID=3038568 RepID=UPI002857A170|nr:FAD-dependent oxidoreductase [Caballeronia sp. LZ035]MDR5758696.1 FAD-dependent oxidoreductase [Caballeronia sp. LZ035]